jgi:hypothetical protein
LLVRFGGVELNYTCGENQLVAHCIAQEY